MSPRENLFQLRPLTQEDGSGFSRERCGFSGEQPTGGKVPKVPDLCIVS
jgi:hypothetical protein